MLLLFGGEPAHLSSGDRNLLADLPMWTEALAIAGAVPFTLAVIRRPRVAANHFALIVRPGWVRTLVLPWSRVAEVTIAEGRYLLVRCREGHDHTGSSPHWVDRTVLRALAREGFPGGRHFDLALRMSDFASPGVEGQIAALAAFAPDHVFIATS